MVLVRDLFFYGVVTLEVEVFIGCHEIGAKTRWILSGHGKPTLDGRGSASGSLRTQPNYHTCG